MKPAKIIIQGDYWDCQIYRGRLYLWTLDGLLKVVNWYALIDFLQQDIHQSLPLACAFTDGNYLYSYVLEKIFSDPDFKTLLQNKFLSIVQEDFIIYKEDLEKFVIGTQDNPFKELQIDTEISANRLYGLTDDTLQSSTAHRQDKKYPVASKPKMHFSINAFSFKANNYSKFAISAGSDGLFEFDALSEKSSRYTGGDKYLKQVLNTHSSFADYSFLSIYNSSLNGSSCMAYQVWDGDELNKQSQLLKRLDRNSLKLEKTISEIEIFKSTDESKLSWGNNEKIYRATNKGLEYVKFTNYAQQDQDTFSKPDFIAVNPHYGDILHARTAYFGSVIEYNNALVVLLSDDTKFTIDGEITRWRIYPRSYNYENHLHVIKDDSIEIYSFNNDYFIDQHKKKLGITYRIKGPFVRKKSMNIVDILVQKNISDTEQNDQFNIDSEDLPF